MKIRLEEARLIKDSKEAQLAELTKLRNEVVYNRYKRVKGEEEELLHPEHEYTVDDLTEKIFKLKNEIDILREAINRANLETLVDFRWPEPDSPKLNLQRAIWLIKWLRNEQNYESILSSYKETRKIVDETSRFATNPIDRSYEEISRPTFDTKKYADRVKKFESLFIKMEMAINAANLNTFIEVEGIELD